VKVRHRLNAHLDLQRVGGLMPRKQLLQFVEQVLGPFGRQFVAVNLQGECLPEEPGRLFPQDGQEHRFGFQPARSATSPPPWCKSGVIHTKPCPWGRLSFSCRVGGGKRRRRRVGKNSSAGGQKEPLSTQFLTN
jgi:hypothetical protein